MSATLAGPRPGLRLPTHLDLPDSDGKPMDNLFQMAEYGLLEAVRPILDAIHPDAHYLVGTDNGIYWRVADPPLDGCKAPDWFYVPNVPPMLDGQIRRSYVLWQELIAPTLIIEMVSGDGKEERDATPMRGKFWVYERVIRAAYYAIYEPDTGEIEMYKLDGDRYRRIAANEHGHYEVPSLGIALGTWQGHYRQITAIWLRFFDCDGNMLPCAEERVSKFQHLAERESRRADEHKQRAEQEARRAEHLAAKLRELGIDPEQI